MAKASTTPKQDVLSLSYSVDLADPASQPSVTFIGDKWSRSMLERAKKRLDRELRKYKLNILRERKTEDECESGDEREGYKPTERRKR